MAKRISDLTTTSALQSGDYSEVSRGTSSLKRDMFDELGDNLGNIGGLLWNVGIKATVAASALTIFLTQSDGATDPGANSARSRIAFRSTTLSNSSFTIVDAVATTSTVISAGSTAGFVSGTSDTIFVYAINNAGTIELAWRTDALLDASGLISTTAEGGAGAADSRHIMYSTTARSNVPCRLLGKIVLSEVTAGNWTTAPTAISVAPNMLDPFNTTEITYTPTFTGFGTVSSIYATYKRSGSRLKISGRATIGTPTATEARISLPVNMLGASTISTIQFAGTLLRGSTSARPTYCLCEPSVGYITLGKADGAGSNPLVKLTGDSSFVAGDVIVFDAEVPTLSYQ